MDLETEHDQISLSNLDDLCCVCLINCKHEGYNVHSIPSKFDLLKRYVGYRKSAKLIYPDFLCQSCYKVLENFEELCSTASHSLKVLKDLIKTNNHARKVPDEEEKSSVQHVSKSTSSQLEEVKKFDDELIFEEVLLEEDIENEELSTEINNVKVDAFIENHDDKSKLSKSKKKDTLNDHLYKCSQCNRSYSFAKNFSRHLTKVHKLTDTIISCPYEKCNQKFSHHETVQQHYRIKHELVGMHEPKVNNSILICEDCGRTFSNSQKFKEHRYIHFPVDVRPFHCDKCKKFFITKRAFKEHELRHLGIKDYECKYCGLRKTTARELRAHINCHTKEKQFPCSLCCRVFNRVSNLNIHDRVVHKGIREFKCRYCDQSFGKPDTLKHHIMRHTGEKNHKCLICGRKFIQPAALKTHLKTHDKKVRRKCRKAANPPEEVLTGP